MREISVRRYPLNVGSALDLIRVRRMRVVLGSCELNNN